ncbi:glycosyltransferase [Chitinimonas sp.]|uniref:glycosyltransferase n=1 Tax=Chitinimonas sp. TaxID=1934313 RepID=UPI0035B3B525
MPLLSIIIAAHNAAAYLQDTLARLTGELAGVGNVEVLLIDDASSDATAAIAAAHASQHPWLRVQRAEFRNVGKVRQLGVTMASGRYISFLDSDDAYVDGAVAWLLAQLSSQQPDALLAPLREVSVLDSRAALPQCRPIRREAAIDLFLEHRHIQGHLIGKCFSRALLLDNPVPPLTAYEDMALLPRLLLQSTHILLADAPFYCYLKRPGSLSCRQDWPRLAEQVQALQQIDETLGTVVDAERLDAFWVNLADALLASPPGRARLAEFPQIAARLRRINGLRFIAARRIRTSIKRKYLALCLQRSPWHG